MSLMPMLAGGIKFRGRGVIVARPRRFPLGLQTGLSPPLPGCLPVNYLFAGDMGGNCLH